MRYYCSCGIYFDRKGRLIEHCALLTDRWPAKSIQDNPDHHPVSEAEAREKRNAAYRRLRDGDSDT